SIHAVIAEASANPLNSMLLTALRSPVEASSRMHLDDNRSEAEITRVIDAHDALVARICAGDPLGAMNAMSYHFDLAMVQVDRSGTGSGDAPAAAPALT